MPKYLLVHHGGSLPEDPAARQQIMTAYRDWFTSLGDALLDRGYPVGATKTVTSKSVTDDGGTNPASGYGLIEASNFEHGIELAQTCPALQHGGGSIEVGDAIEFNEHDLA